MSGLKSLNKLVTDPLKLIDKAGDKWGMQKVTDLYREGPIGNAGGIKAAAGSKGGAYLSGRGIQEWNKGGPKDRDMESARTFDVFGSPATAGTGAQPWARAGAAIYGLWMAGAAMGGSAASGGAGGAAGGSTSAAAAPTASAAGGYGATNVGYAGSSVGSGAPATASSPGWQDYYDQYSQYEPPQQEEQQQPQQEEQAYLEQDEDQQYWASRGMQLRAMADHAVRRYLS